MFGRSSPGQTVSGGGLGEGWTRFPQCILDHFEGKDGDFPSALVLLLHSFVNSYSIFTAGVDGLNQHLDIHYSLLLFFSDRSTLIGRLSFYEGERYTLDPLVIPQKQNPR